MFVGDTPDIGETLALPEDESRHLFKVLRARQNDLVEVVGAGEGLYLGRVVEGSALKVVEKLDAGFREVPLTLFQSVPKGGRMDLVVEKATEAGATRIVPLLAEHGEVSPREGKVERWRRVAEAAARQSLRLSVPEVTEPMTFAEALRDAERSGVLLHNVPGIPEIEDVVGATTHLFVGPEGGWSEGELEAAGGAGVGLAGLGPYRLRSETAGIVAVARARAALGRKVGV